MGGVVGLKWRQLYLNNNKKKKKLATVYCETETCILQIIILNMISSEGNQRGKKAVLNNKR